MTTTEEHAATVSQGHADELAASEITEEVRTARGYRTMYGTEEDQAQLRAMHIPRWAWREESAFPGLLMPMYRVSGEQIGMQFKPCVPQEYNGKPMKYASQSGVPNRIDVPPAVAAQVQDPTEPLWITEGVKKADALASKGRPVVTLTGVFNWRSKNGTLGDWEDIPLRGRTVVICFDADARENRMVLAAMRRLGSWLESKGAAKVLYLIVPGELARDDGSLIKTKGVDDFFHAGGTLAMLGEAASADPPGTDGKDATFSDAVLADTVCAEELEGRFRWAQGLGWMQWDGKVWREASEPTVMETIRLWAVGRYTEALQRQQQDVHRDMGALIEGWRGVLSSSKISNLIRLGKGILECSALDFDSDADAINCQNGIVDLRTGVLTAHDPDRLMTKIAGCDYVKAAESADWTKALEAVPDDVREWLQLRLGQGITGYPPPDDLVVLLQGGGENGKSTIMDAVKKAVGKYRIAVSDRAMLGSASEQHPTELMDFMGARLAVLEETPEENHLDTNRVKKLAGTAEITARRIRQDDVTFPATHSLFINTNHPPVVTATDHGTWRRLAMLCFPFTFRKPGVPLQGPDDRTGDPTLRQRLVQEQGALEAVLAWTVLGAQAWYSAGQIMAPLPLRVEADTAAWRRESDLVLAFIGDCLAFDQGAHIESKELHTVFNEYVQGKQNRPWTDRTFKARFGAHDECKRNAVEYRLIKAREGRSSIKNDHGSAASYRAWLGVRYQNGDDQGNGKDQVNSPFQDRVTPVTASPVNALATRNSTSTGDAVTGVTETDSFRTGGAGSIMEMEDPFAMIVEPAAPPVPETFRAPVSVPQGGMIGFDIESHSSDKLFTHDTAAAGPYAKLTGWIEPDGTEVVAQDTAHLLARLESSEGFYGHNIFRFDLMALALHHGADYDRLARKAYDTYVDATVLDPPASKGTKPWGAKGYYGLDQLAGRLGLEGKTDRLPELAAEYGVAAGYANKEAETEGYGLIKEDDPRYRAYFSGDLKATKGVRDHLPAPTGYRQREQRIAYIQNRMTLSGWRVDTALLRQRKAEEDQKRDESLRWLAESAGVPMGKTVARGRGKARHEVYEPSLSPLTTTGGREAVIKAFQDRGATAWPTTTSGMLAMSSDALGDASYLKAVEGKKTQIPAMFNPAVVQWYQDQGADVAALRELAGHILTVTGAVQKYAEIMKYVRDGRVHGHVGADQASGRWAMVKPSVTNLGKRGEKVHQRGVFVADPGCVLLAFDLDQVDMRAIAGHCQDPAYMRLFEPGSDAHSMIADLVYGRHDGEWREKAKRCGHGWNYGMSVNGLVNSGVERETAQRFDDGMQERFPTLISWRDGTREYAGAGNLLDNGFGRLMRCDTHRAWTQAPALIGQGGARDILCEGLLRMPDEYVPWMRGVVHDEVVFNVPEARVDEAVEVITAALTLPGGFRGVPITCGASRPGHAWDECYAKD